MLAGQELIVNDFGTHKLTCIEYDKAARPRLGHRPLRKNVIDVAANATTIVAGLTRATDSSR
jgi:hypothetical protein